MNKEYTPKQRTTQQNRALRLFLKLLSDSLNTAGLEMRIVLKPTYKIWWTPNSCLEHIWRPMQKAKFNKKSTTELNKIGEIDEIHEDIMRMFGEKWGLEYIPFPHDPNKGQDYKDGARGIKVNY